MNIKKYRFYLTSSGKPNYLKTLLWFSTRTSFEKIATDDLFLYGRIALTQYYIV